MIWGLTLQPGELYTENIKDEVHLSMAALESRNVGNPENAEYTQVIVQTESAEYLLCTLVHGLLFQQYIDLKLMPGEKVKFCVQGKYVVHLIGYSSYAPMEYTRLQVGQEESDSFLDQPLPEEQEVGDDQYTKTLTDIKEEPPGIQEVAESNHNMQECQGVYQEYPEPSGRAEQQEITENHSPQMQHQPLCKTMVQRSRPYIQQTQQRTQTRMRRRFMTGQRSKVMQRSLLRHRGASFQQRNISGSANLQSNAKVRLQQRTSLTILSSPLQSSVPRVAEPGRSPQPPMPASVSYVLPHALLSQQEESYPTTEEYVIDVEGKQNGDLPRNSQPVPYVSPESMTGLGDELASEPTHISISEETSMRSFLPSSDAQGTSGATEMVMPETSGDDIAGTSSIGLSGMSQGAGEQMNQKKSFPMRYPGEPAGITGCGRNERDGLISCQLCKASFVDIYYFDHHECHNEDGSHKLKCQVCNKTLSTPGSLKNHLRTHKKGKPYQCSYCPEAFKWKHVLQRHVLIHSGERPYCCRHCGKGFKQSGHLSKHLSFHHGESMPYKCRLCSKEFKTSKKCREHEDTHST